jgi:hypothetical protein
LPLLSGMQNASLLGSFIVVGSTILLYIITHKARFFGGGGGNYSK